MHVDVARGMVVFSVSVSLVVVGERWAMILRRVLLFMVDFVGMWFGAKLELALELGKMHVEWSGGICTALLWWGMQWRPEIAVPCKSVSGPLSHDLLSLVEVVFFFLIIFSFLFYFWFMRRDY